MNQIVGLVPVLATPFESDASLDLASLRSLVEFELASGADGVGLFGTASETFALSRAERLSILKEVNGVVNGEVLLVLGVNGTSTVTALEQVKEFSACEGATLMVMPSASSTLSPAQLFEYYGALAEEALTHGQEIMVQDAPLTSGVVLSTDTIAALSVIPGVTSIKVEAPPTVPKIEAILDGAATIRVLGGQNALFVLDEYSTGAVGTMPACEFTDQLRPILDNWAAGRVVEARAAFTLLLPLIVHGLQSGYAWAVHKEVLVKRGIIASGTVRLPARRMTAALRKNLDAVMADNGIREIVA